MPPAPRAQVQEARALEAEIERLRSEHQAALQQARTEAQREVAEIMRRAEAEQKQLIAQATRGGAAHARRGPRAGRRGGRRRAPHAQRGRRHASRARSLARSWNGRSEVEHGIHEPSIARPALSGDQLHHLRARARALSCGTDPRVLPGADRAPARRPRRREARAGSRPSSCARSSTRDLADLPGVKERLRPTCSRPPRRAAPPCSTQGREAADRIRADARLVAEQEAAVGAPWRAQRDRR